MPVSFYAQIAEIAKELGIKLVLDTSGPALMAALEVGVYLCKPNVRELSLWWSARNATLRCKRLPTLS